MNKLKIIAGVIFLLLPWFFQIGCDSLETGYRVILYNSLYLQGGVPFKVTLSTYSKNIVGSSNITWEAYSGEYSDCVSVDEPICIHSAAYDDDVVLYHAIECIFETIDIGSLCSGDAMMELKSKGSSYSMYIVVTCIDSCAELAFQTNDTSYDDKDLDAQYREEDSLQSPDEYIFFLKENGPGKPKT